MEQSPRLRIAGKSGSSQLTLLILGVIAFMYFAGEVLKPLALSVLLSFALTPVARFFERLGMPRPGAAMLTIVIVLALMGGIGYVVGEQLNALAQRLPGYQQNIENKLRKVSSAASTSTSDRLTEMVDHVASKLEKRPADDPAASAPVARVEVVEKSTVLDRLRTFITPYLEYLGVIGFVLVLVLFMLAGREELRDRIVRLFGHGQVGVTTRTMEEIGWRISRYLAALALVNSSFGLVVAAGLYLIGLPYAVLWGVLAALLRFLPYLGTTVAVVLPLVFSFANAPGWLQPLEVLALFVTVEVCLNSFLEPIVYGKSTGVSALGLLIAALFWTWLWGIAGLFLATPLTVCLVVVGKYAPSLGFFSILLGESAELEPDVRLYQRLVALDREGAEEVVEAALKVCPRVDVFDQVLIPSLSRAEHDAARGTLDESEQTFAWDVVRGVVADLEGVPEFDLATVAAANANTNDSPGEPAEGPEDSADRPRPLVVGIAVEDTGDVLVLEMLRNVLTPAGVGFELIAETESPLELAARLNDLSPTLVVVSHLPPNGMRDARYMVRRLRAQFPDLEIVVGAWGNTDTARAHDEQLTGLGTSRVVHTLSELREHVLGLASDREKGRAEAAPLPA
ncbi:MAG: AI-2E family transporter [Isosphaeraceae bacterium]